MKLKDGQSMSLEKIPELIECLESEKVKLIEALEKIKYKSGLHIDGGSAFTTEFIEIYDISETALARVKEGEND